MPATGKGSGNSLAVALGRRSVHQPRDRIKLSVRNNWTGKRDSREGVGLRRGARVIGLFSVSIRIMSLLSKVITCALDGKKMAQLDRRRLNGPIKYFSDYQRHGPAAKNYPQRIN